MVSIQGLSGVPEPKSDRTGKVRSDRDEKAKGSAASASGAAQPKDDVNISSEARGAAEVNRLAQLAKSQSDIRADKVAAAKERIANGDYKNPEVVAKVAERLIKYLT